MACVDTCCRVLPPRHARPAVRPGAAFAEPGILGAARAVGSEDRSCHCASYPAPTRRRGARVRAHSVATANVAQLQLRWPVTGCTVEPVRADIWRAVLD